MRSSSKEEIFAQGAFHLSADCGAADLTRKARRQRDDVRRRWRIVPAYIQTINATIAQIRVRLSIGSVHNATKIGV
jgi:hypothetical protein